MNAYKDIGFPDWFLYVLTTFYTVGILALSFLAFTAWRIRKTMRVQHDHWKKLRREVKAKNK